MMTTVHDLENYVCSHYETKNQLHQHVLQRSDQYFRQNKVAREQIKHVTQLKQRQQQVRKFFLESIGQLPSSDVPLQPNITDVIQKDTYKVEKVIFQARKHQYVTGNLYIPKGLKKPAPTILFLSGHEYEAKHSSYYHHICLQFTQENFVVFAVDPIGQGERISQVRLHGKNESVWGTAEHQHFGAKSLMLGENIARYFLHDNIRAIDYLYTREEVDTARIAVTGNSGGGTQTAMLMMYEGRICAAAPGTYITNRQTYMHAGGVQDAEQVWPGFTKAGFDHEDILLSFAPKPLIVLAAKYDFFPIEGTRETVHAARRYWELYQAEEKLHYAEDASTHYYTNKLVTEAIRFFKSSLGVEEQTAKSKWEPIASQKLQCTTTGQILTDYPEAKTIQVELNRTVKRVAERRKEDQSEGETWLHSTIFNNRKIVPLNPRRIPLGVIDGIEVEYLFWWSQKGIINSALLCRHAQSDEAAKKKLMIAVWQGGTTRLQQHWQWVNSHTSGEQDVFILNTSGVGPHEPYPIHHRNNGAFFGALHKLADELIWIGDSLAAIRIFDIIRCLDVIDSLEQWKQREVQVYSHGPYNFYTAMAKKIDQRIKGIQADCPLASVQSFITEQDLYNNEEMSLVMPGLFKYTDIK